MLGAEQRLIAKQLVRVGDRSQRFLPFEHVNAVKTRRKAPRLCINGIELVGALLIVGGDRTKENNEERTEGRREEEEGKT